MTRRRYHLLVMPTNGSFPLCEFDTGELTLRLKRTVDGNVGAIEPVVEDIMKLVVDKFMKELQDQLVRKKVSVRLSDEARTWLAKNGHDPRYGARPLTRLIQTEVKDVLSDEILFGQLEKGGSVFIDVAENKLTFSYNG